MAFIDDVRSEGHAVESTCRCCGSGAAGVAARIYQGLAARPSAGGSLLEGRLTVTDL